MMTQPTQLDLVDQPDTIAEVSARVKAVITLNPKRQYVVEGERTWSSMVLAAQQLIFKPGSKLIFDNTDAHAAGHFHIVVNEIVIEDPANPGIITWYRDIPPQPADRGQAANGAAGAGEGAQGGNGAEGAPGATGLMGASAPDLTVYVRTLTNGGPIIDFAGGKGGPGGRGQIGGTGGAGGQGGSARQSRASGPFGTTIWLPSCESGPGQGGNGGSGGHGGDGGVGGKGGTGGNVTLVSRPESITVLFEAIRVDLNGGVGGDGGQGSNGGAGGAPGPEGPLANFCNSAGRNGVAGAAGGTGQTGPNGEQGKAGQPFVASLSDNLFATLFGFE